MATKKKKTSARTKGSKKKSTSAKKSTRKTGGSRRSSKRTAAKKTTTKTKKAASRKTPRKKTTKKKSTAKKATGKKKTTRKKKVAKRSSAGKSTKKKTSSTVTAGAKKKKTSNKKSSSRKSTKGAKPAKSETKPAAGGNKAKRSQSVVEAASSAEADKQGYVFINGRRVRMISTQGKVAARKSKVAKRAAAEEEKPVEIKPGKSKLSKKELRHYRDLLLIKRAELVGDLSAMEAEALRSSGGNISHMPIHMADIGSDAYEQDFMLGMAETERKQIREVDEALQRIKDGTYGVCHMTGKPIPKARLDAKPWAKYTIEAARILEGHWQP